MSETERLIGHHVLVHDLKARPELNGLCGEAKSFDSSKGRFAVKILGVSGSLLLKLDNLERMPEASNAIAACCHAEHADEVRERVRTVRSGSKSDDPHMQYVLDLEDTGLRELPPCVGTLAETRELWLGNNGLTALPSAIGCIIALRQLDLITKK